MNPFGFEALIDRYQAEVLRWNRQINLVSRAAGARGLDRLVAQCSAAAGTLPGLVERLTAASADSGVRGMSGPLASHSINYVDVGSGAGLPGIVWHAFLEAGTRSQAGDSGAAGASGPSLRTVLVEPKEKRAWFLQRVIRELGLSGISVAKGRWGDLVGIFPEPGQPDEEQEVVSEPNRGQFWLVSLKALRMGDPDVVAGWRRAVEPSTPGQGDILAVVRFSSPDAAAAEDPAEELNLPPSREPGPGPGGPDSGHFSWPSETQRSGGETAGVELLVSWYRGEALSLSDS